MAERNYAQIEKEGLALILGVKKFHKYVYSRSFTLVTDHKPLLAILGLKKDLPLNVAALLQRWAIFLLGYQYDLQFCSTGQHSNADGFSRLQLSQTTAVEELAGEELAGEELAGEELAVEELAGDASILNVQ